MSPAQHFSFFISKVDVRADVEKHLKAAREEKKRLPVEAMQKGTVPTMVFCRFCGARNKSDQPNYANCGSRLNLRVR